VDADLSSKSTDWRGCNIWASAPLWCPHLHCNALHYCPTIDGYKRCADSRIFSPHPIQHLASAIVSPSPRILNLHLPKNFQMCVPSAQESVSALVSDGYITIHWLSLSEVTTTAIHCVWFQISSQLTGNADRWQDRQQRPAVTRK